ncbi:MAG: glycine betaine ABC transporter substrate-binding protein [Pseudomonadota bacterium]
MATAIRIGHIGLSFHEASALEVARVLSKHGLESRFTSAPHEEAFELLGRGEVDLLASAWLPSSHQVYLEPLLDRVDTLTVLYEPYCIWGVPDYVPESDVAMVEDLLAEPAKSRMDRLIQGINPGAGISRFSLQIIADYGLDKEAYVFRSGSEQDCFGRFEQAYVSGDWIVVPLWHPQYLHNRYTIRALHEPKGLLGSQDEATLIVHNDAKAEIGEQALADLSQLYIGNGRLSALEDELIKSREAL